MAFGPGLGAPGAPGQAGVLRLGTVQGVPVYVRYSFLLVGLLISVSAGSGLGARLPDLGNLKYLAGAAVAVLLGASILVHEASHAVVARHYDIGVRSITLHALGGVTDMVTEPPNPKQEFAISVVGPLSSLALGGVLLGISQVTPAGLLSDVSFSLAVTNLLLGVFNLVPGWPLDGGRVFRSIVWKLGGNRHRGTIAAGWSGRIVAALVLGSPVLFEAAGFAVDAYDWILAFVLGWFLYGSSSAAILGGRMRDRMARLEVRRIARRTQALAGDLPIADAVARARGAGAGAIVLIDDTGRPWGVVNEAALAAVPEDRRAWMPISMVARTLDPGAALDADLTGEALVEALLRHGHDEYLVLDGGTVYGVLVKQDVDAAYAATA